MTFPVRRTARLTAVAAVAGLALTACAGDGEPDAEPAPSPSPSTSSTPTDEATSPSDPTPTDDPSDDPSGRVPDVGDTALVYYATDTPTGTRLAAESTALSGGPSALAEVAGLVAAGRPADPDYAGLFPTDGPRARVGTVEVTADATIEVEVRGNGWARRPAGTSRAESALAVQSLVYSLQAAVDEKLPVVVVDRAGEPTTLFGVDTAGGVKAAPQGRVLALVNVLSPAEGATVSGSFRVHGLQQSFEGTVPWELRDADGDVVKKGVATGSFSFRRLTPFRTTVRLSGVRPGTYTFAASTDDPSGGEGGGPTTDTKTVEVE